MIIKNLMKGAAAYALWSAVTVCDPHLVSEEAAENSKILRYIKDGTDMMFTGMKLCCTLPIIVIDAIREELKA